MIPFGETLKAAREAKGLTQADIAEKTHMMTAVVADLENEDFSRIAAPIYGRGFVKLYCETVGLDPKPMVAEFMEIFNGNRESAIRERPTAPVIAPETKEEPSVEEEIRAKADEMQEAAVAMSQATVYERPEPPTSSEPPIGELDLFNQASYVAPQDEPTHEVAECATEISTDEPQEEMPPHREAHPFSRYAAPLRDEAAKLSALSPSIGRWCVVAVLAILVLWGLIAGIRALYRATSPVATKLSTTAVTTATKPEKAKNLGAPKKTNREAIKIPDLYID